MLMAIYDLSDAHKSIISQARVHGLYIKPHESPHIKCISIPQMKV